MTMTTSKVLRLAFTVGCGAALLFVIGWSWLDRGAQQFSLLASSFLHGHTYFPAGIPVEDGALFGGRTYWPLGPFPAVALMLPTLVTRAGGSLFFQGYLQAPLTLLIFALVIRLARLVGYERRDAWYWAAAFCFGSAFVGVAMSSQAWFHAQVVATCLLLLALVEFCGSQRYVVIGTLCACLLLTRATAALVIVFFVLEVCWRPGLSRAEVVRKLASLAWPVAMGAVALLAYDYVRFGNPFEQGYRYQQLLPHADARRAVGLFSFAHLPTNLYYAFVSSPKAVFRDYSRVMMFPYLRPNEWGMSMLITSPYAVLLFVLPQRGHVVRAAWVAILAIATPIFLYYGIGYTQFGYRYALDFFPLMFLVLLVSYRAQHEHPSNRLKVLIAISAAANIFLVTTMRS